MLRILGALNCQRGGTLLRVGAARAYSRGLNNLQNCGYGQKGCAESLLLKPQTLNTASGAKF